MKALQTYLNFDGETREAMMFYQKCLGAQLVMRSFREAKVDAPEGAEDRIVHARLEKGSAVLMASDTLPGMPFRRGTNFAISIECESVEEIEKLFKAFSEGSQVTMPLQDTFWNSRFGMLTDRFGVGWMFNCALPQKS
jgi:PhnB protein